jgi:hypothetical protein
VFAERTALETKERKMVQCNAMRKTKIRKLYKKSGLCGESMNEWMDGRLASEYW